MAGVDEAGNLFTTARMLEDVGEYTTAIRLYHDALAADPDDHCGAALRLARFGLLKPDGAPVAYVATLFDQHAEDFDRILVEQLAYQVHRVLKKITEPFIEKPVRLLDLGCGTGLVGAEFNDVASFSVGVDVSEKMLEVSDNRRVYDDLYVGEVVKFLREWDEEKFDLITAADLVPYLGDLTEFAKCAAQCLSPGGLLAFSTERGDEGWGVTGTHRFWHATDYLRDVLTNAGFTVLHVEQVAARLEEGEPVEGDVIVAKRTG